MTEIRVLGVGCPKCKKLAVNAEQAANELGLEHTLEKVTDLAAISAMGVMMTPALVVDGAVKVVGKAPSTEEIKGFLQ